MNRDHKPSAELNRVESAFLLAVSGLRPVRSRLHISNNEFEGISKLRAHDPVGNELKGLIGNRIPGAIPRMREDELYPDTGESGETYDVESFRQFKLEPLQ